MAGCTGTPGPSVVVGPASAFPAVFATAEPGWTFSLQLFPERGEALLSGGTPCLPDPRA